jgi:predicted kinase
MRSPHALPPHARESAKTARDVLRRIGVPFTMREHAVALILNHRKPEGLAGSLAETHMRLACQLDLRCLHHLAEAELRARGASESCDEQRRLDAFRRRAEELGVFGSPPEPPLGADEIARLSLGPARETHRAANALRYFRLCAGLADTQWARDRLHIESAQPRGRLNLLIGPAGSGKSAWAEQHLSHTTIISSDLMRRELTGDPADQSQNYLVFQRCRDKARSLLRQGAAVTFDATNYMEDLRELPVQAARWCAAEIHAYFIDTSLETALKRNLSRTRLVPEQVIQRHYRLLTPPALYEADQHWVVGEDGAARLYWPTDSGAAAPV